MTAEAEHLDRIRELLRVLLEPKPLGKGPIRLEDWNQDVWTQAQRDAFEELRAEAGLPGPQAMS